MVPYPYLRTARDGRRNVGQMQFAGGECIGILSFFLTPFGSRLVLLLALGLSERSTRPRKAQIASQLFQIINIPTLCQGSVLVSVQINHCFPSCIRFAHSTIPTPYGLSETKSLMSISRISTCIFVLKPSLWARSGILPSYLSRRNSLAPSPICLCVGVFMDQRYQTCYACRTAHHG